MDGNNCTIEVTFVTNHAPKKFNNVTFYMTHERYLEISHRPYENAPPHERIIYITPLSNVLYIKVI